MSDCNKNISLGGAFEKAIARFDPKSFLMNCSESLRNAGPRQRANIFLKNICEDPVLLEKVEKYLQLMQSDDCGGKANDIIQEDVGEERDESAFDPKTITETFGGQGDSKNLGDEKEIINNSFSNIPILEADDKDIDPARSSCANGGNIKLDAHIPQMPSAQAIAGRKLEASITQQESINCKPAKIGVAYRELLPHWVAKLRERSVSGLPAGLTFSDCGNYLEGTPTEHGELKAVIRGIREGGRPVLLSLHVPVLPDPRALWKAVDSDPNGMFAKPDSDQHFEENHHLGVEIIAASVRGRSHAQKGGYRDDDFCVLQAKSGWLVLATADGAGSALYSRHGSHLAAKVGASEYEKALASVAEELETVCEEEKRTALAAQAAYAAVLCAVSNLEDCATKHQIHLNQLSTTLILVAAKKIKSGWLICSFGIGDGGAVVLDLNDRKLIPLTKGDSGEFAGQTKFLRREEVSSYESVKERSSAFIVKSPTAIFAMTDGITDPKFETESLFQSFDHWEKFWNDEFLQIIDSAAQQTKADNLRDWMGFWSPGNHDDRTLAVAVFR